MDVCQDADEGEGLVPKQRYQQATRLLAPAFLRDSRGPDPFTTLVRWEETARRARPGSRPRRLRLAHDPRQVRQAAGGLPGGAACPPPAPYYRRAGRRECKMRFPPCRPC